jgi:hypothetical protein
MQTGSDHEIWGVSNYDLGSDHGFSCELLRNTHAAVVQFVIEANPKLFCHRFGVVSRRPLTFH